MLRSVQSAKVAVERMAEVVADHVLCLKAESGWEIHVLSDLDMDPLRKSNSKEVLAYLADIALMQKMDREEVYSKVLWTGQVPVSGISAWQESALCWLRYGTLSHPKKQIDLPPRRKRSKK